MKINLVSILSFMYLCTFAGFSFAQDALSTNKYEKSSFEKSNGWTKTVGIKIENYSPSGTGFFADQSTFNFSDLNKVIMPTISFGYLSSSSPLGDFLTSFGLDFTAAFASQDLSQASAAGVHGDGKFQTSIFSIQPLMRFHWRTKQKIFTRLHAEFGHEQINLNSTGSLGSFSRSSEFLGYGVGLEWDPFNNYGFLADYYERIGTSADQKWSPSTSSYQLGAIYLF